MYRYNSVFAVWRLTSNRYQKSIWLKTWSTFAKLNCSLFTSATWNDLWFCHVLKNVSHSGFTQLMKKSIYHSGPWLVGLGFICVVVSRVARLLFPGDGCGAAPQRVTEDFGSRFTISALSRYRRIVRFNTPSVIFLCAFLMESFRLFVLILRYVLILLTNCLL